MDTENSSAILTGRDIRKTYPSKSGMDRLTVLDGINIEIPRGGVVAIVGSSGSGKSTLLHVLGGLDHPDNGSVLWNSQAIYDMDAEQLAAFRNRKLGFVFQFHHLLPEFTAAENVLMPALIAGVELPQARERAMDLLDRFGIAPRADHRPTELSGGEQQRVAMARALMNDPELILADEPTGNLDEGNTEILLNMLFDLREKEQVSILLVTHEKSIASRADTIFELSKGVIKPTP